MSLRVFHPGPLPPPGGEIVLGAEEARHLVRVRRARPGDAVQVLDGRGGIGLGLVDRVAGHAVMVRLHDLTRQPAPPARVLAVGLPKGDVFEEIIRQATELGATALQPLLTARSEVRLAGDPARLARKLARWRTAAAEAGKQSGNPWFPAIAAPLELAPWLASLKDSTALKLVAALTPYARSLHDIMEQRILAPAPAIGAPAPSSRAPRPALHVPCFLAAGPEGDFTPEEYHQLTADNFLPLRLPGHVLRVETACAAGLAILAAAHGQH